MVFHSASSPISLSLQFSLSPLPLPSSLILTHPFPIDQSSPPLHLTLTLFPSLPPMSLSPDEEQSSVRKFASLDFHIVVFYSQIHSLCLTKMVENTLMILSYSYLFRDVHLDVITILNSFGVLFRTLSWYVCRSVFCFFWLLPGTYRVDCNLLDFLLIVWSPVIGFGRNLV